MVHCKSSNAMGRLQKGVQNTHEDEKRIKWVYDDMSFLLKQVVAPNLDDQIISRFVGLNFDDL